MGLDDLIKVRSSEPSVQAKYRWTSIGGTYSGTIHGNQDKDNSEYTNQSGLLKKEWLTKVYGQTDKEMCAC